MDKVREKQLVNIFVTLLSGINKNIQSTVAFGNGITATYIFDTDTFHIYWAGLGEIGTAKGLREASEKILKGMETYF